MENKSIGKYAQNAKEYLGQKDVKVPSDAEESGVKIFSSGASAFAYFFNDMAKESKRKAQKEMDKPKYRFIESIKKDELCGHFSELIRSEKYAGIVDEISELQEKISDLNYEVEIVEDLDCKNVTEESRYYIRIANKNGVCIELDLFEYEENIKDFNFNEQEFMEEKISKITGSINKSVCEIAKYTVEYLAYIVYFKELYTLSYKKIGWEYYDWNSKGWIFKYDKIYTRLLFLRGRGKNKYIEGLTRADDNVEKTWKWVNKTIHLINHYPMDALIFGAGLSGLIRQILPFTKETNININIVGKPASGKSIICHYVLGMFGNPEILEGSFTDTENATEERRVLRPILPYILDDRMLKLHSESENSKKKKVLIDIFREYEGKVKERLGKQYEDESGERTYGPIISSSVDGMMDYLYYNNDVGQYRRFIELNIERTDLFKDGGEAKEVELLANSSYGFGIEIIVDYIFTLLDDNDSEAIKIIERFNDVDKVVSSYLEDREMEENRQKNALKIYGMSNSSKRFALIILSYQILRESLLYFVFNELKNVEAVPGIASEKVGELIETSNDFEIFSKSEKLVNDKAAEICEILTANLVTALRRKNTAESNEKYIEKRLYDYIIKHPDNFAVTTDFTPEELQKLYDLKDNLLGYYILNGEQSITLYCVNNFALDQFWEMNNIPEPSDILKYCKEVKKLGYTPASSLKYGAEHYDTIAMSSKDLSKSNNKPIFVNGQKKAVKFTEKTVEITQEQNEDEK